MRRLFVAVDKFDVDKEQKIRLFLGFRIIFWALMGAFLYLLFGKGFDQLLLLAGYPAVINGFFVSTLYLFRHDFT